MLQANPYFLQVRQASIKYLLRLVEKTFGEREVSFLRTINAEVKKSISLDNNPLEDEKNSGNDNKYNEGEIKLEEDSLNTSKNILTQSLPCQPIMSDDDDDSFDILSENVQIIAQNKQ